MMACQESCSGRPAVHPIICIWPLLPNSPCQVVWRRRRDWSGGARTPLWDPPHLSKQPLQVCCSPPYCPPLTPPPPPSLAPPSPWGSRPDPFKCRAAAAVHQSSKSSQLSTCTNQPVALSDSTCRTFHGSAGMCHQAWHAKTLPTVYHFLYSQVDFNSNG